MFILKRKTTAPATPIKIIVDAPQGDGDGGFMAGGQYHFYPAGSTDGPDTHQCSEIATRSIMEDPAIAVHFECTPPWQSLKPGLPESATAPEGAAAGKGKGRRPK